MNTLDDLRGTLDRQASGLDDPALRDRPGAVRGRVRVARRRRQAGVAGALALVLATAGVSALGLRGDGSADRQFAGATAPASMRSLGYAFDFARGVEGEARARLRLDRSEQPRLVSWATAGADDQVTLRVAGQDPRTLRGDDFGDFLFLAPGTRGAVTLRGRGDVALAVYDLRDVAPKGYTRDGITFRDDVGGQRLLGAVIGAAGEAETSLRVTAEPGQLPVSYLCSAGPEGSYLHLSVNGGEVVFGGGCDDATFDPAAAGGFSSRLGAGEADDVRLRMWVTQGRDGDLVRDADVRIGIGAYAPAPSVGTLAGTPLTSRIEYEGHRWRLGDWKSSEGGRRDLEVAGLPGRETLVVMSFAHLRSGTVRTLENGARASSTFATGGAGSTLAVVPVGGGTVGLRATGDVGPRLGLGLARYVRAD